MPNKDKIEYALFMSLVFFAKLLGINKVRYPAKLISYILFYLFPIRKETVIDNLQTAFPELKKNEIKKIAFNNYYSFLITLFELMCFPYIPRAKLHSLVEFENMDLIEKKLKLGKGLMLFTAHFGNWELGAAAFGSKIKRVLNVIAKQQRNPYVTQWLNNMRETFGNKVIPLGMSIRTIYSVIKESALLGVVGDQRGPKEGMRVKIFGKETAVYQGSAEIALKNGTPIVCVMIERQEDYKYKGVFEEIKTDSLSGEHKDKVYSVMQQYMTILESYVRQSPEQWFWMHKIWKY